MEQILLACQSGVLKGLIEPVLVIASKECIGGIKRATQAGFDPARIAVCGRQQYASIESFGNALLALLRIYEVELVGQYGWLCKTPETVIEAYPERIVNQHPGGLDPGYLDFGGHNMYGRRVHSVTLGYYKYLVGIGEKRWPQYTEATAHWVEADYDKGPVIGRIPIEIKPDDTPESLAAQVLPSEHTLQVDVLENIARGTIDPNIYVRQERLVDPWRKLLIDSLVKEAIIAYPHG